MSAHTPTPWVIDGDGIIADNGEIDEMVRRVNAYEALVAENARLREALRVYLDCIGRLPSSANQAGWLVAARAALAQSEVGAL